MSCSNRILIKIKQDHTHITKYLHISKLRVTFRKVVYMDHFIAKQIDIVEKLAVNNETRSLELYVSGLFY